MDKVVSFLNNKYLIAAVVALFLISTVRMFAARG